MASRREFLTTVCQAAAVPAIPSLLLGGCGTDSLKTPGDANTVCSGLVDRIGANHGHTIRVTIADVVGSRDKTFSLTSNGSHSHLVTFSAAELDAIANGGSVTIESTVNSGHSHDVSVSCIVNDAGADASQDSGADASMDASQDSGVDSSTDASVSCATVQGTISSNHGHVLDTVTQADVQSGATKMYTLSDVGHSHAITLTSTEFGKLMQGMVVMVTSTLGNGHTHQVTLQCV